MPSLGLWVGVWDYFGCVRSYSPANFPVPYGPVKLLLSCFVESGESRAREEEVLALNDTWGSWMKMHAKKRRKKKKGGGDGDTASSITEFSKYAATAATTLLSFLSEEIS